MAVHAGFVRMIKLRHRRMLRHYHSLMESIHLIAMSATMKLTSDDLLKLMLAVICGGMIGAEREFRDKAAGFRTLIFICMGSTFFTLFSHKIALEGGYDPGRITANIVSGVGFLGAGVILHQKGNLVGLTTAALVWFVAALGVGIGSGEIGLVAIGTGSALIILLGFPLLEKRLSRLRELRIYEVTCAAGGDDFDRIQGVIEGCGLAVFQRKQMKNEERVTFVWDVIGRRDAHDRLQRLLVHDPAVLEVRL